MFCYEVKIRFGGKVTIEVDHITSKGGVFFFVDGKGNAAIFPHSEVTSIIRINPERKKEKQGNEN